MTELNLHHRTVVPEASFIAETSFVDAPLNSRVINTAAAHQERITTKRLRQLITKTDADEDDESDLQQIDDQDAQDDQTSSDPLDDISQADLVIQEALLVEDLLGVLIVSLRLANVIAMKPLIQLITGYRRAIHTHEADKRR